MLPAAPREFGQLAAMVLIAAVAGISFGQSNFIAVTGGPTFSPESQTGLTEGVVGNTAISHFSSSVSNVGTAVGYAKKYMNGTYLGTRPVIWGDDENAAEMEVLGTAVDGFTHGRACAINDSGIAAGYVYRYVDGDLDFGRAVRWSSEGVVTELGNLGEGPSRDSSTGVEDINSAGLAVGFATKFSGGSDKGSRAVRWELSGVAATELGTLGSDGVGHSFATAVAVNETGTAVGTAYKYVNTVSKGYRAVRWEASGTVATELGALGTNNDGWTEAYARAVNSDGTAVGEARTYIGNYSTGIRAVRWAGSGTVAEELGGLGVSSTGWASATARDVNDAGTTVGYAHRYGAGVDLGARAVRWDSDSSAAHELEGLGTAADGSAYTGAYAVDSAGFVVGYARQYVEGVAGEKKAVMWRPDGTLLDLNSLIDLESGWMLEVAKSISSNGQWIAGEGTFDPDGLGPLQPYPRLWLIQVPEPTSAIFLALAATISSIGFRRRTRVA